MSCLPAFSVAQHSPLPDLDPGAAHSSMRDSSRGNSNTISGPLRTRSPLDTFRTLSVGSDIAILLDTSHEATVYLPLYGSMEASWRCEITRTTLTENALCVCHDLPSREEMAKPLYYAIFPQAPRNVFDCLRCDIDLQARFSYLRPLCLAEFAPSCYYKSQFCLSQTTLILFALISFTAHQIFTANYASNLQIHLLRKYRLSLQPHLHYRMYSTPDRQTQTMNSPFILFSDRTPSVDANSSRVRSI